MDQLTFPELTKEKRINNKQKLRNILHPKFPQKRVCSKSADVKQIPNHILPKLEEGSDVVTILDLDPDFFKIVSGRPIKPCKSIREYKEMIRKTTLSKVCRGFVEEEITRLQDSMDDEKKLFDKISNNFEEYKGSFDKYLSEDYRKTMEMVNESDAKAKKLQAIKEEHKTNKKELCYARSQIRFVEEILKNTLHVASFFRKISPDFLERSEIIVPDLLVDLPDEITAQLNIDEVKVSLSQFDNPILHFTKPTELVAIFQAFEEQFLDYVMAQEFSNIKIERLFSERKRLRKVWDESFQHLQHQVEQITKVIEEKEGRANELETTYYQLLNGLFKYVVSSKPTLNLFNDIIFVFETIITKNEVALSIKDMVELIEKEYEEINSELDSIEWKIIKEVTKNVFVDDLKEMRQARKANKALKNINRVKSKLASAFKK